MNGPEHYQEAERLIRAAQSAPVEHDETSPAAIRMFAEAQVHATLALAAAGAGVIVDHYKGDSYLTNAWSHAIGWVIPAEIVDDDLAEQRVAGELDERCP